MRAFQAIAVHAVVLEIVIEHQLDTGFSYDKGIVIIQHELHTCYSSALVKRSST